MFLKALSHADTISQASKSVGISRRTYYNWLESDDEFQLNVDDIAEATTDIVESELLKRIKEGNVTATIFYLKCKAKNRGYVERQEVTGANGNDLPQIVVQQAAIQPPQNEQEVRALFKI